MARTALLIGFLATFSTPLAAQVRATDAPHVQALRGCQAIPDPQKRLECFDRTTATIVNDAASGGLVIMSREEVGSVRRSLFGLPLPKIQLFGGGKADEDQPKVLETTLRSMSTAGVRRYRFKIAEGDAIWETVDATPDYRAKPGDKVTVRKGALGSYFLKAGNDVWVRVRRVE